MQNNRRTFLLNALAAATGTVAAASCTGRRTNTPLTKAAQFLWAQQSDDGGWHSTTYGLLRSGQSLTPFVLLALLGVPENISPQRRESVERALAFIQKHTNADGALGLMDESALDYPNYATALAVSAFVKANRPNTEKAAEKAIAPMVAHLRAQQFSEANGWTPKDGAYGGWGMGGPIHRPPATGHVDLSMTRFVLEALQHAGVPSFDAAMTRALAFLERCQNPDGGFYFSPVNPEINKAGKSGEKFVSYGTATTDGVLALRAAGVPDSDARASKALRWLREHHRVDRAPDVPEAADKNWATGLRFYYAHAIARTLPDLPIELPQQADDGSFRNSNNLVKEDDPLIATALALYVLAR